MVLAETVQIDGGVVLAFLIVFGLVIVSYLLLLWYGARAAYRGGRPTASREARLRLVPLASIDAGFFAMFIKQGMAVVVPMTAPAVIHGIAWFFGRTEGEGPPPS
jgi:hypothetical protein